MIGVVFIGKGVEVLGVSEDVCTWTMYTGTAAGAEVEDCAWAGGISWGMSIVVIFGAGVCVSGAGVVMLSAISGEAIEIWLAGGTLLNAPPISAITATTAPAIRIAMICNMFICTLYSEPLALSIPEGDNYFFASGS